MGKRDKQPNDRQWTLRRGQEHAREKPFVIEKDEPQILLGTDLGANPVEYALTALAVPDDDSGLFCSGARSRIKRGRIQIWGNAICAGF